MNDVVLQRLKTYEAKTPEREREALREIIQEIALLGLWRGKFFEHAAFYGGTALRILYGLDRFSEDLDFTLTKASDGFDLASYCKAIRDELVAYGFEVSVEPKEKGQDSAVESAFIKAETLVHQIKIKSRHRAVRGQLLKVKFEVDTNPALEFKLEAKQFFWPIPFSVTTCDLPSLFSGKLHELLCRQRTANVKGRDFYDFLWYVGRGIKPSYAYIEAKLRQTKHWSDDTPFDETRFRSWAKERLSKVDITAAKRDVERFLADPRVLDGWSQEVMIAAIDRI